MYSLSALPKTVWVQHIFSSLAMGGGSQWKPNCFHIFCSLTNIDFAAVISCAKSTYRCLYNRNQFSFVLGYDGVVIFIHKQAQCVRSASVCVCVFSYPGSFLAIGSREPRETARALSIGEGDIMEGNEKNKREAGWVRACIIMKVHLVFICTIVGYHLQLHTVFSHR